MKHLKDIVLESLLDDEGVIFDKGKYSGLISRIFSKNSEKRSSAFDDLKLLIESYNAKQHKTTNKMKNSDSYFIQFSKPFKIENGEVTGELMPHISYIDICKRVDSYSHRTIFINASDSRFGLNISDYVDRWQYIRQNFTPQSNGCTLYEVPEELNELFGAIQVEAQNYQ